MNELGSKLSALKNITIDMHQEVSAQDRLLDESNQAFGGLGQTMRQSYSRMNRMISTRHKRQLCYYVTIIVVVFFFFYYFSGYLFGSSAKTVPSSEGSAEREHEI
ncbi:hypothetical protein BX666DRAFT_1065868 [Dichotomocladium elegans]|nr:hypothetical protein BX666DRAFT_1065868 [Dichotomocladium elegans]